MSNLTGTVEELLYVSQGIGTGKASFTTEVTVNDTAGMGVQAELPANFWLPNNNQAGRAVKIHALGVLACTATPTFTPTVRLGTSGSTTGPIIGQANAPALTMTSGATSVWELFLMLQMVTRAANGANSTVRGVGKFFCPALAASHVMMWGGGTSPGTVATVDPSVDNYINLNFACSASSASNSVLVTELDVHGLN
jgi:hypothetical protein